MEELDYWRLCDELNIVQAALLVVGEDPSCAEYIEDQDVQNRPKGYEAAKTAICSGLKHYIRYEKEFSENQADEEHLGMEYSIQSNTTQADDNYFVSLFNRSIAGTLVPQPEFDMNGNNLGFIEGTIDVYKSTVSADSLKQWLRLKGFKTGFFFPKPVETTDFLDPLNPRYAPKLAAAVKAWQAVTDAGKKSPKQALDKWLREHATEFGLTNDEGNPIEQAIEECSKVANWNTKGGATKTPS
ncbi:MAG: hypothetical protein KUG76_04730 [Gammaproteobacteria bacterium]|nr:hypothetical protein [Gammaproteobacteria bacterium]